MLLSQKCVGAKFDFFSAHLPFSACILQPESFVCVWFFFFSVLFSIWSLESKQQVRNHCIWGKVLGDLSLKSLY